MQLEMVVIKGYSFFEPVVPVKTLWREILDAFPKVDRNIPPPRSTFEVDRKTAFVAAGALAAVSAVYYYRDSLRGLIPTFQRFKTALGYDPPVVVKIDRNTKKNCFESLRSGSNEEPLLAPKFQALVGEMQAGEFNAVGCAVRMGRWLVMPSHVYAATEPRNTAIKGKQSWIRLGADREYEDLDTDLIAFELTEKELSMIGVGLPSISHAMDPDGAHVQIVGPAGKGTVGTLKQDVQVFGRVVYLGSTVAGYSGAAYTSGNSIVGIHTNGGAVNGGYSASYVYSLLSRLDKNLINEDSDDWLRNQYQTHKRTFRIDRRWHDLDDVRVEIGGRYAIVTRANMARAFGKDWYTDFPGMTQSKAASYDGESSTPSGEENSSTSGGSSSSENAPGQSSPELVKLIRHLNNLPAKRCESITKLLVEAVKQDKEQNGTPSAKCTVIQQPSASTAQN